MADPYNAKNYREQGGERDVIGGEIDIVAGGKLKVGGVEVTSSAAELNIVDGVTKTAAQINALIAGAAGGYKLTRGQATTVAASDDIDSGLAAVVAVVVQLDDDPVDGCMFATASIGNQAGAPAAGHFYLKTWKNTDADSTLIAATTFSKKVNWVAIGT